LIAIDSKSVISFVTNPNQIIHFKFDDEKKVLQTVIGIQTKNKALKNIIMNGVFLSSSDDLKLKKYDLETFQQLSVHRFDNPMKAMCRVN
jgi:hypothetical protein